eukprot:5521416-Alexandrium_andersonii.AAC.1
MAAVVSCGEHTEPLFFAAAGASEVVSRLPVDPAALPTAEVACWNLRWLVDQGTQPAASKRAVL